MRLLHENCGCGLHTSYITLHLFAHAVHACMQLHGHTNACLLSIKYYNVCSCLITLSANMNLNFARQLCWSPTSKYWLKTYVKKKNKLMISRQWFLFVIRSSDKSVNKPAVFSDLCGNRKLNWKSCSVFFVLFVPFLRRHYAFRGATTPCSAPHCSRRLLLAFFTTTESHNNATGVNIIIMTSQYLLHSYEVKLLT